MQSLLDGIVNYEADACEGVNYLGGQKNDAIRFLAVTLEAGERDDHEGVDDDAEDSGARSYVQKYLCAGLCRRNKFRG